MYTVYLGFLACHGFIMQRIKLKTTLCFVSLYREWCRGRESAMSAREDDENASACLSSCSSNVCSPCFAPKMFFFSKLFSGNQGHCVYWYTLVSESIFQQVCHQKQLNWFVCLFVFAVMFAALSLEKRDRHRATEQWVSNSSLSARLAYRASLIYFHFTTLKTVGSGYSNIFINLPR